ncbi:hypothetical protein DFA_02260 [Cavenderia fasciculata]|uniref:DUF5009 domain-containing protein n=1 Tax=Cavenderia fasciculata TaxID=261658 RepID=F4PYY8_CACFS|nr:uncharacterized protein DFA_02260 [Cavenderia fasciculata]EGG19017.1 hypothetical protein DFA_02260 [Cavenderia fasciculata]|eukprot:XP_004366650.1 hypothetical protein DFA_02260 [Cavenderia fasciculata]
MSIENISHNHTEKSPLLNEQQHVSLPINNDDSTATITKTPSATPTTTQRKRVLSLDTVRGLTIFGMILVDNQGGPQVIWPLLETEWNGLSTADLIFPSFLFICGFSVALALKSAKNDIKTWYNIIRRTLLLFFIQAFLNLMAHKFVFDSFRVMGVLQRISICYFACCCSFLLLPLVGQRIFLVACAAIYLSVMYGLDVPGCGRGVLTPSCNAGSYIDNSVLGANMIHPNDPEGLLSTFSAFITTWMGLELGRIFTRFYRKHDYAHLNILIRWIGIAVVFGVTGIALGVTKMPVNKLIWSFSFALITVACGSLLISVAYYLLDVVEWSPTVKRHIEFSIQPFMWIGMNPISIYTLMIFIEIIFMFYLHTSDGTSLWTAIYEKMYLTWLRNGYLASTVFSLGWFAFFDFIAFLILIIGCSTLVNGQVNCVTTPSDSSCVNYQYPIQNITQDIGSLCGQMKFMALCDIQQQCQTIDSQSGVCNPFSILADGCQADMPKMGGCSNYNSLCGNGSVVQQCTKYQMIPSLPQTKQLSQYVYSICTSMNMDACSQCTIPPTYSMLQCDVMNVYTQLCQQMPDMTECASWKSMCEPGTLLQTSSLNTVYCELPVGEQIPLMRMFFHTGILDYILFETWVPRTRNQFIGYWFLIFFAAIIFECEKTLRSILEKRWEAEKQLARDLDINSNESLVSKGIFKGTYPTFNLKVDLLRGFLHGFELTLSYLLMLVAMTFNVALFFAVIAGTIAGNVAVGRYRSFKPKVTCCD